MYKPSFRHTKNGVPIISKAEIDAIAENYIRDFCPKALDIPTEIDIDSFVLYYLGLAQDFQYLSYNGVYLGMTVFNNTDNVPVYNPETNTAEYIYAKARTVIIDNSLLEENQENRYRFTMGHESGHDIFHTEYFSQNQMTLFQNQPMIQCKDISLVDKPNSLKHSDDKSWIEWQANYMASALLMPKTTVEKLALDCRETATFTQFIIVLIETFNVSIAAACCRLNALGLSKCFLTSANDFVSTKEILVEDKIHQIYSKF